jgi:NADH-quinone oxidoreductase subunit L
MTVPMILLAVGSVFAGFLLTNGELLAHWLSPSLGELQEAEAHAGAMPHALVPWLVVGFSALGALIAYLVVGRRPTPVERPEKVSWPVRAARKDLYANALNEALFERPGLALTAGFVATDDRGVDGVVNGTGSLLSGSSSVLRRAQTGFVRSYALSMLGGSLLVVAALLAVRFA